MLIKIKNYPDHNWIWVAIWEMSEREIRIVVTVNKEEMCRLGEQEVFYIYSANNDIEEEIMELKKRGRSLVRKIRRKFPDSNVRSRLKY